MRTENIANEKGIGVGEHSNITYFRQRIGFRSRMSSFR